MVAGHVCPASRQHGATDPAFQLVAAPVHGPALRRRAGSGRHPDAASAAQPTGFADHPGRGQRRPTRPAGGHLMGALATGFWPRVGGPGRRRPGFATGVCPGLATWPGATDADPRRPGGNALSQRAQRDPDADPAAGPQRSVHLGVGLAEPEQLEQRAVPRPTPHRWPAALAAVAAPTGPAGTRRQRGEEPGRATAFPAFLHPDPGRLPGCLRGQHGGA